MPQTRTDLRCPVDRFHTVCKITKYGPVCTLCGTLITKDEVQRQMKQLKREVSNG